MLVGCHGTAEPFGVRGKLTALLSPLTHQTYFGQRQDSRWWTTSCLCHGRACRPEAASFPSGPGLRVDSGFCLNVACKRGLGFVLGALVS